MEQQKNSYINPKYIELLKQFSAQNTSGIYNLAEVGDLVSRGSTVRVWRRDLGEFNVYVKRYQYKTPSWKFFARKSKAKKELEAYRLYAKWEILHPEVLCYVEKRVLGRPSWAIIITREIEDTHNLEDFFQVSQKDTALRTKIMEKTADMAYTLYKNNFKNPTFRMRNILWQEHTEDNPLLFLIDTPSHTTPHYQSFRIQHYNITQLYRDVRVLCSEDEWQAFLKRYCELTSENYQKLQKFIPQECMRRFGKPNMQRYKKL